MYLRWIFPALEQSHLVGPLVRVRQVQESHVASQQAPGFGNPNWFLPLMPVLACDAWLLELNLLPDFF
jgi:hypothetical protein